MVRVTKNEHGLYVCPCGKSGLRTWQKQTSEGDSHYLESHLPPGEKDPSKFCAHSHETVDDNDGSPFGLSLGDHRGREESQILAYGLGREDEEITGLDSYNPNRVPFDYLGMGIASSTERIWRIGNGPYAMNAWATGKTLFTP